MNDSFKSKSKSLTAKDITFVTHADYRYTSRLIALIESMATKGFDFNIIIICHDKVIESAINNMQLGCIETFLLDVVEKEFPDLLIAKNNRTYKEYIFCLTPFVIEFANRRYQRLFTIYLDADLYFFSDPKLTISSISQRDLVTIVPHRYGTENKHLEFFGIYNVGWIAFNCGGQQNEVLDWWMGRCLESTSISKSLEDIYGDQKYLDRFKEISECVSVDGEISHNVAPWNVRNFVNVYPEKLPVYYHFSGMQRNRFFYISNLSNYRVTETVWINQNIYKPYIRKIMEIDKRLEKQGIHLRNESSIKSVIRGLLRNDLILYGGVFRTIRKVFNWTIEVWR